MLEGAVCSVVFCGAPLTRRAADIVLTLSDAGLHVQAAATPAALSWLDVPGLRAATGLEVLVDQRSPDLAKRGGRPDAAIVVPATFNTVSKLACGIADTYAHALLCEHLGVGRPLVIVPFVNDRLWGHPAWCKNLQILGDAGAVLLDPADGESDSKPIPSGEGDRIVAAFQPGWLLEPMRRLLAAQ